MRIKERHLIKELNQLLGKCKLPAVENVEEVSPSLLIALYESLKQERLAIQDRKDRSKQAQTRNIKLLVAALSKDLVNADLSHLNARQFCAQDRRSIVAFLDIVVPLGRILSIGKHDDEETESTIATETTIETSLGLSSRVDALLTNQILPSPKTPRTMKSRGCPHVKQACKHSPMLCKLHRSESPQRSPRARYGTSFLVDSPYTKYLKARKEAAVADFQDYSRWKQSNPLSQTIRHTSLITSVDSNASFYGDL